MVPVDDGRERFRVVVWRDANATERLTAYDDLSTAQEDFQKLRISENFYYGELLKWIDYNKPWELLDSWEHRPSEEQEMPQ